MSNNRGNGVTGIQRRDCLELALRNQKTITLERQHAQGYTCHPVKPSEFEEWESEQVEQVWGEL
jgi:hypothetical protein